MKKPVLFDPAVDSIALTKRFRASAVTVRPDPPLPVDGATFGVATMIENSPHGGEMHADGDEVLYLISGRARIVFLDDPIDDIEMMPGHGLVVPKGIWHRVDILEPSQLVYLTPGPNNEFRALAAAPGGG